MLMIYEINHIWIAEIKWKWRNDRRSETQFMQLRKKDWKKIQDFNGVQTPLKSWTFFLTATIISSFLFHFRSPYMIYFTYH